jgi:alkyl sulfatase BDS1-like metallo-beta-lactamase superfamily hydrolase
MGGDYAWFDVLTSLSIVPGRSAVITASIRLSFLVCHWRSAFLAGAAELRHGQFGTPAAASADLLGALTVPQVFDSIAIRVDGPKAWDEHLLMSSVITDAGTTHVTELRNGVLNHRVSQAPVAGSTTLPSLGRRLSGW